ncbi:hypothetical protein EON83_20990 [bacterium]|nr:MAG: hypothetical protein EON83_20990 [bacterium]
MLYSLWVDALRPWAQYAVSIFNFLLMLWLSLTVFLNARERSWGTYLAGSGLMLGAVFFALHTVALDYSLDTLLETSPGWWAILSLPVVALPLGWLLLMLWHCGAFQAGGNGTRLKRRMMIPLCLCIFGAGSLVALSLLGAPRGRWTPFGLDEHGHESAFWAIRALLLLYPFFLVLCTGTSLAAVSSPIRTESWRREEAIRRARPLLFASSLCQFLVSLGVAGALVTIGTGDIITGSYALLNLTGQVANWIDDADLTLIVCISLSVLLFGKAVVSYEIFTGKTLPRRGVLSQWRAVIIFAALYATLVGGTWGMAWRPIYTLLLSSACLSSFLALFAWRALAERDRELNRLRAFVSSGHWLEGLASGRQSELDRSVSLPLETLCESLIGASRAALIPSPLLAPLFGEARVFPQHLPFDPSWNSISTGGETVRALGGENGWTLAARLGAERETGILLLGPRRDGALYTVEEIELARSTGAYLLDIGAAGSLAARLRALQSQKLAEIASLDTSAKRRLHDDILPLLHGALLSWNVPGPDARDLIVQAHRDISNLLRELPSQNTAPPDALVALKRELEVELASSFDSSQFGANEEAHEAAKSLSPSLSQTLFFASREALRNTARHARGGDSKRELSVEVRASIQSKPRPALQLLIEDDGIGSNAPVALSKEESSGAGLGLHAALLAIAGGELAVERHAKGTRVSISVPLLQ